MSGDGIGILAAAVLTYTLGVQPWAELPPAEPHSPVGCHYHHSMEPAAVRSPS
ncbi:hypothetical protein [Streptomyces sp. NPDC057695]|uniref:hypothetical protein n=1 Tax=Streptomyces sp. NPDC057695 TaxID=3346217 RepID=UPI0036AAFA62